MTDTHADFIAAGGNRHPSAADWHASGLLAYGADCNVALWRPNNTATPGVHALLKGHTGTVNAVKFLQTPGEKNLLLSGGTDKQVRVWQQDESHPAGWREAVKLEEHETAVNAFAVLNGSPFFASASADAHVSVWQITQEDSELHVIAKQRITLSPTYFALALELTSLEASTSFVLAVAGTNRQIQIYVSSSVDVEFKLAATLTGHEGWIRSLAFVKERHAGDSDLLLASASQDKYVRLWRLHKGEQLPAVSQASSDPLLESISKTLSNKPHRFNAGDDKYSITFEALLVGHEDWIYTARWDTRDDQLRLLTASADSSLSIWELDLSSGIWICSSRLGEISAQKGATTATGSSGGFWIGLWSPEKNAVVSLGRTGAWRLWQYSEIDDTWNQEVAVTGHTRDVKSLTWSPDGVYLLTTGSDQTTRMFAEWHRHELSSWHEVSRPQIHGYDLNCIDSLGQNRFVSGADEKLLRVFDQPKGVAKVLSAVTGVDTAAEENLPDTAQIPVMGLSNKATDSIEAAGNDETDGGVEEDSAPIDVALETPRKPPVEDQLGRHLLWPEHEKLYGHGYEVCAVAANRAGTLIATACRASSIDHAVIRLYETDGWREMKPPLKTHSLTVTSLGFSHDDQYLLSVGRDRQCCIWSAKDSDKMQFELYATDLKAHSRMILDCAWLPSNRAFITAGRDKKVHVWGVEHKSIRRQAEVSFQQPVTAIACLRDNVGSAVTCAAGLEDGSVLLLRLDASDHCIQQDPKILPSALAPAKAITSLAWRPRTHSKDVDEEQPLKIAQLAVASEDTSFRILAIPSP
ncbi:MAG: hypothetical protein Q9162_003206 [Coniocarpon cinnabarinum]